MTRVLWINPVGTAAWDEPMREELERLKRPDTEVEVCSLASGPTTLEYRCFEAAVVPDLLATIAQAERDGFDATVIGCFNDMGLPAAREIASRIAVAAPCESAVHIAATLAESFSIVGVTRKVVPVMRDNVRRYGFGDRLASFKLLGFGVDDFHADEALTSRQLAELAREAVEEDGAEAVVLGCTMTFGFFEQLQEELGVPVLDPVAAPLRYAELLADCARLGWRPSLRDAYRPPAA